jgi:hypothetical protein
MADEGVFTADDETELPDPLEEEFAKALERLHSVQEKDSADRAPDELAQAIHEAQVAWLRLKWGAEGKAPACPYCQAREWSIGKPIYLGVRDGYYWSEPMFLVGCGNCGHTTLVNAEVPGIAGEETKDHDA